MEFIPALGIDVGSSNSIVAAMRRGRVHEYRDNRNLLSTPSTVTFNQSDIVVGAMHDIDDDSLDLGKVVFDFKRMIGRKFNCPDVQRDIDHWPFAVKQEGAYPHVEVVYKSERQTFAPEEIYAMILRQMQQLVEADVRRKVIDAVITVPAYFNIAQRQATIDAGRIAGLNVLQLLSETVATAIAYHHKYKKDGNIVVYDLGGGTFDVSVINIKDGNIVVKATSGDTHLGGQDFDYALAEFCADEIQRKHNVDIRGDKRAVHRLRTACERAKQELSSSLRSSVIVDSIADDIDKAVIISRAKFEELNLESFLHTIKLLEAVLNDAGMNKDSIDCVVLVGGSTRIPLVQQLLKNCFNGTEKLDTTFNRDETVAFGAAICAAAVRIYDKSLQDVIPISIVVDFEDFGGAWKSAVAIPKNTAIPSTRTTKRRTLHDNQKVLMMKIRQGDKATPEQNTLVGQYIISDFSKGPAGSVEFHVSITVDANGVIQISATEKRSDNSINTKTLKIEKISGRAEHVVKMMSNAEAMREVERGRVVRHRLFRPIVRPIVKTIVAFDGVDGEIDDQYELYERRLRLMPNTHFDYY